MCAARLELAVTLPLPAEAGVDPDVQERGVVRVRQVIDGTERYRADRAADIVERGDDDDRQITQRSVRTDRLEYDEAVHPWHRELEQHQIVVTVLEHRERSLAVRGDVSGVAEIPNRLDEARPPGRAVVDDQDASGKRDGHRDALGERGLCRMRLDDSAGWRAHVSFGPFLISRVGAIGVPRRRTLDIGERAGPSGPPWRSTP